MPDLDTKFHIEKNTVQETLIIPLFARKVCTEHFPNLFNDEQAERICSMLDYDFSAKSKRMESTMGLFGALEVAQRQYDLAYEVTEYLKTNPKAAVVNLGCGLDDTFRKCDNGKCLGFNIDMEDVIKIRDEILPAREREKNLAYNLNDEKWLDEIPSENGAVFFASGVFYYFKRKEVKKLLIKMAERFPRAIIVFDACNKRGAKMMTKTWLKEAGISDVNAYFSIEDENELCDWSDKFSSVSAKSYMRGYRDIYKELGFIHKRMIQFCDKFVRMKIIKVEF